MDKKCRRCSHTLLTDPYSGAYCGYCRPYAPWSSGGGKKSKLILVVKPDLAKESDSASEASKCPPSNL